MTNFSPDPEQSAAEQQQAEHQREPTQTSDANQPVKASPAQDETSGAGRSAGRLPLALVAIAVVAFVGFLGFAGTGSDTGTSDQSESIYDFALARPDQSSTTLRIHEGKPMVVNYFAAWCPPCRRELPDFEAVHQALGDEVEVVGISRDNTTSAWLKLIESTGLTYDTFFEGNTVGSYEFVKGLAMPTTAFVSAEGNVVHTFSGALTEEALTDLINEHLLDPELDN